MTVIRVYDANGREMDRVVKAFNHRRSSMRCADQQKVLDSLYRPGVVSGTIQEEGLTEDKFTFISGRSIHQISFSK